MPGKAELNMEKAFMKAYKNAMVKSVEYTFAKCYEYAPVAKSRKGTVNLRNALKYDFDWEKMEGCIGLPAGSDCEKRAFYTEYGCFFNPYYKILTKQGTKRFMDLTCDDEVLTHRLRWKKIEMIHKVLIEEVPEQAFITIDYGNSEKQIITTKNHPYLVERENKDIWIEAKDLKEGDIVYRVTLIYNNDSNMRKRLSDRMTNRIIPEQTHKKMSGSHWFKNPKYTDLKKMTVEKIKKSLIGNRAIRNIKNMASEHRNKQAESLKKFYLEHPEKHPNYILSRKNKKEGCSKEQNKIYLLFKQIFKDAIQEYPIKTKKGIKFIDITIPSIKLAVEYDGVYWHKNSQKQDLERQILIGNEGWKMIRFSEYNKVLAFLKGLIYGRD